MSGPATLAQDRRGTSRRKPAKPPESVTRHDDPDVETMLLAREDVPGAFDLLMQRYWPRIFGHFFRSLGDRQEAEDLTQDVFLRLYRSRKRYQPRARFATWLYHVTQNVARNAIRSRRRHPTVHLDALASGNDGALLDALLSDRGEEPSRPVERAEVASVVREAVSTLASRQRTALELHQFEDWTYNQVAAQLDMSPEAAKSLLYRARNQLRETLSVFMREEV